MTKRAVKEALYQPRRVARDYGRFEERDSPVIGAARDLAAKAVEMVTEDIVTSLRRDPEVVAAVKKGMAEAIQASIAAHGRAFIATILEESGDLASQKAFEAVMNHEIEKHST